MKEQLKSVGSDEVVSGRKCVVDDKVMVAVENKRSGRYNCAQAVACAYADEVGMEHATLEKLAAAFGTGMGSMEATCGALIGAGLIVGAVSSDRLSAMKNMRGIVSAFQAKNGATVCKLLKGVESGVPLRGCDGCVEDSARLLQDFLRENVTNL